MSEKGAGDPPEADEGFVLWEGWMFGAVMFEPAVEQSRASRPPTTMRGRGNPPPHLAGKPRPGQHRAMQHIADAAAALAAGRISAASLVDAALDRIADPRARGRAFTAVHAEAARAQARAMDALRHAGRAPSPWAGIPITVKDLFDEHGHPTPAGSTVLRDAPAAAEDAPVVARLKRQGFVVIGRTNMVEFAFSGLGVNPHYGTPLSPWDRKTGAAAGRVVLGRRGRRRRPYGLRRAGDGYRRVLPGAGGAVRRGRLQADGAAGADHRRAAAVALARFGRAAGPQRRLLRPAGRGHQRRGSPRSRCRTAASPASGSACRAAPS